MQKIEIRNFGPIPYCNVELKDFMIFIGQQATGKSTICKCIYFFKSVRDEVIAYLHGILNEGADDTECIKAINKRLKYKFVNIFGQTKYKNHFSIRFDYADDLFISTTITKDSNKYLDFHMNETLSYKINNLRRLAENEYHFINSLNNGDDRYARLEKDKAFKGIEFEVNKLFSDSSEIFYIPAGRGLLSLLTDQLLLIDIKLLDYISGSFMRIIQEKRISFDQELEILRDTELYKSSDIKEKREMLLEQITGILKGQYYFKNGKEYLKINNESSILINYASSGQQEVIWILNLLFLWSLQKEKSFFVVIEEPEAHLYPDTQKSVLDYIAMFSNVSNNQIMVTTHSPYILTSANNLLYAGKVGSKSERVDKIIPKDKWLNSSNFAAYLVGQDPQDYVRSIVDDELEEIAAEEIDKISKVLRNDYAEIFDLEAHNEFTK